MLQDIWRPLLTLVLFMKHEMVELIIRYTNAFVMRYIENHDDGWYAEHQTHIDIDKLNAFLACLLYAGFLKSHHESCEQLWAAYIGRPFLLTALSFSWFKTIVKFIQFDDKAAKDQDKSEIRDRIAPVVDMWNKFVQRYQMRCNPGYNYTVDEQLIEFCGNCPMASRFDGSVTVVNSKGWSPPCVQ